MGLNRGFDCNRPLSDRRVVDFCRNGYLKFDGVVPDDVNRRVVEFLDRPDSPQPDEILKGDWFVDAVIKNSRATGAARYRDRYFYLLSRERFGSTLADHNFSVVG